MIKPIALTNADSVADFAQQNVPWAANQRVGCHPTLAKLVTAPIKHNIIITVGLANLANSMTIKQAVPYPFTVNSILFRVGDKAVTTASKAATVQAQITGTPMTGGTVALVSADLGTTGGTKALSAITALNTGVAGDTIELAVSSVTTFSEGTGSFEVTVTENMA